MSTNPDPRITRADDLEREARRLRADVDDENRRYWRAVSWVLAQQYGDELIKTEGHDVGAGDHAIDPDQPASIAPTAEMVGGIHTEVTWDEGTPEAQWVMTATCSCGYVLTHTVPCKDWPQGEMMRQLLAVPPSHLQRPRAPRRRA